MKKKLILAFILSFLLLFTACTGAEEITSNSQSPTTTPKEVPVGEKLFSFAVFGDNGDLNPTLKSIISEIDKSDAQFLISTGDNSDGKNTRELPEFKQYLDENLDIPYNITIGDNDYPIDSSGKRTDSTWRNVFGETKRSFDVQNSHFVMFDSSDEKNSFTDQDLEWLEKDLSQADKDFLFVIMHIPVGGILESYSDKLTAEGEKQNDRFLEIVKKYEVDQIYTGHFHGYLNYEVEEIPVAVTGGAGSPAHLGFEDDHHYLLVNVYENGFENKYKKVSP